MRPAAAKRYAGYHVLVVGEQEWRAEQGFAESTKHKEAKEMLARGKKIRIIEEAEFLALVRGAKAQEARHMVR